MKNRDGENLRCLSKVTLSEREAPSTPSFSSSQPIPFLLLECGFLPNRAKCLSSGIIILFIQCNQDKFYDKKVSPQGQGPWSWQFSEKQSWNIPCDIRGSQGHTLKRYLGQWLLHASWCMTRVRTQGRRRAPSLAKYSAITEKGYF